MLERLKSREEHFWARVDKSDDSCWVWTGHLNASGYGRVRIRNGDHSRSIRAHRVAFALHHGVLPKQDEVLRHTCDHPWCVAPAHLVVGTHADNVRDRVERGRSARGDANGRAKLSSEDVRAIDAALAAGVSVGALAERYCVARSTIYRVRDRRTWCHVPPDNN